MVAVSASPLSEALIRWTRRMADSLKCPWLAVHVENSRPLDEASQSRLAKNLATRQSDIIGVSMERHDILDANEQSVYSMFMMNVLFGVDKAIQAYNKEILLILRNKS